MRVDEPDAHTALSQASQAQRRTIDAGRWFGRYLLAMAGLGFIQIIAIEVFLPDGLGRHGAITGWLATFGLLNWWASSHDVVPAAATRHLYGAAAAWFGSYLVLIGPVVRWKAGTSLAWWSLASAVMASPFIVAAWRESRRP
jgi:hypothetical protein